MKNAINFEREKFPIRTVSLFSTLSVHFRRDRTFLQALKKFFYYFKIYKIYLLLYLFNFRAVILVLICLSFRPTPPISPSFKCSRRSFRCSACVLRINDRNGPNFNLISDLSLTK